MSSRGRAYRNGLGFVAPSSDPPYYLADPNQYGPQPDPIPSPQYDYPPIGTGGAPRGGDSTTVYSTETGPYPQPAGPPAPDGSSIKLTIEGAGSFVQSLFSGTLFGFPKWAVLAVGAMVAYKAMKRRS